MDEREELDTFPVVVVVIDPDGYRLGTAVEYDSAVTLWATLSENPHNWNEIAAYWSRYRSPATCEFVDALPITPCERSVALEAIRDSQDWMLYDLVDKRIFTGREIQLLSPHATLAMVTDEHGKLHCPLPLHLPPWWELSEQVDAKVADEPRNSEIRIPRTHRQLLYGPEMIDDLASRILDIAKKDRLPTDTGDQRTMHNALYALTVEVHREWLMTPREDLDGRKPRDLLHGAHGWSDSIIEGQRRRFEDGGPMVAAPDDVVGYDDAPMGREEMIIYFDLCREVIDAGWQWCRREQSDNGFSPTQPRCEPLNRLSEFLSKARDNWLEVPFEGGSPPRFIIECSRRRVPRGAEVPIVGMDQCESEQHMPDCECPLCDMMQSGLFGVGFTSLDGHHLDLDDEFAFSTNEFYEDWEQEQREYREMTAAINRESEERKAKIAAGEIEDDEFASAWSAPISEEPLPGDPFGHMHLAFRLAEIIGDLEVASAPREVIKGLNRAFREYRQCDAAERAAALQSLGEHLEATAERYPELLSKVVDFQSQIDELERGPIASQAADDDDVPF